MGISFSSKLLGIKFTSNTGVANAIAKVADTPIKFSSDVLGVKYSSTIGRTVGGAALIAGTAYAASSLISASAGAAAAGATIIPATATGGIAAGTAVAVSTPSAIATTITTAGASLFKGLSTIFGSKPISNAIATGVGTALASKINPEVTVPGTTTAVKTPDIVTTKQASTAPTTDYKSQIAIGVTVGIILLILARA